MFLTHNSIQLDIQDLIMHIHMHLINSNIQLYIYLLYRKHQNRNNNQLDNQSISPLILVQLSSFKYKFLQDTQLDLLYLQYNSDLLCIQLVLLFHLQYYNSILVGKSNIKLNLLLVNNYHHCKNILIQ